MLVMLDTAWANVAGVAGCCTQLRHSDTDTVILAAKDQDYDDSD